MKGDGIAYRDRYISRFNGFFARDSQILGGFPSHTAHIFLDLMDWFREKYKETIVLPVNHGGFLQIPDFTFKSLLCRIDGKFCFSRK